MRSPGKRLHHFDALRALTMVLILPVHALALIGLRGGLSAVEASVFWTLHVFRMPLFFLVAGFFFALMIECRDAAETVRNRALRIGVPFVFSILFVVPPVTVCLGAISSRPYRPGTGTALGPLGDFYPSYLWFLWYLILLYAATLLLRTLLSHLPRLRERLQAAGGLLRGRLAPLALAVPCGLLLYRQPTWIAESTPGESFVPALDLLAYYGVFFFCGWALQVTPGLREAIERQPRRYALYAGMALPPALALYLLQGEAAIGQGRWFHLLALGLLALTAWSVVFALLGISRRYLSKPSPRLRYWSDASYWIYLSHFLPMAAIAAAIAAVGIPDGVRIAVLIGATALLICPAYGVFVRHSPIGRMLHGSRGTARPSITHSASKGRSASSLISVSASSAAGSEPATTPTPA